MPITYATDKLRLACEGDSDIMNKLSRAQSSPTYGTPGPRSFGNKALHCHLANNTGIAFERDGTTIHVFALGKKSGQAGQSDSGYKWYKKGNI